MPAIFGGTAAGPARARPKRDIMRVVTLLSRARLGPALLGAARLAALAVLVAASPWAARAQDDPALQAWKRLDRANQGFVTFDEFVRASDERLKPMDTNGDGNIGRDEFMAYHEAEARRRVDRIFEALDQKGTGRLAAADLKGAEAQRLVVCDTNKDGFITKQEYLQCRRRVAERWMQRIFAKYDKNGDGFIGREERIAALRGFFNSLDTNKDGRISREEFGVAQKRWADRRSATTSNGRTAAPQSDLDALK